MKKRRIFIGSFIKIDNNKYNKIKKELKDAVLGRWTPLENFHITYKFIGEVDENQLENIKYQLKEEINKIKNVNISLDGLGAFPSIYNPKVLFIKANENESCLTDIHNFVEDRLSFLGIKKSEKEFVPHITLMRIKKYRIENFLKGIHKFKDYNFGTIKEIEVNIIESILNPKGAIYKKISD
jgi:2'-5' RNA ligase